MSLDLPITLPVRPVTGTFDDKAIQRLIDQALENLPPGKTMAIVAHADLQGARLAVMGKIGGNWSFAGHLDKSWNGTLGAGAEVRFAI